MSEPVVNEPVEADGWRSTIKAAQDAGCTWFDWLDCVDEIGRSDEFRLVLQLVRRTPPLVTRRFETRIPREQPVVHSIGAVFAGALWAEREIAEMFGVQFLDGDDRPLLLPRRYGGHPLRKDEVLGARAAMTWPGAKEPGEQSAGGTAPGRRRMVPPGVPDREVWGDRDPAADPATPGEIAASGQGGRVRRRR